jgi:hypothetical protein
MRVLAIVIVLSAWIAGSEGSANAQTASVGVVTRTVAIYSNYELRLAYALRKNDKSEIDKLVSQDFEEMTADPLNRHIPRSEWIAQSSNPAPGEAEAVVEQMAAHDHGDIRLVSFILTRRGRKSQIVDVWKKSADDNSVLVTRYTSMPCP